MSGYKIDEKSIFFILKEQIRYGRLRDLERYRELDEMTLDLLVKEGIKFAENRVAPLNPIGESRGLKYDRGRVTCPPEFREVFREYGENGWTAAVRDPEYGGQGFPTMLRIVLNEMMYGACTAFTMAPSLTHGAAHLIETFGTAAQKELFVPNMYGGRWAGTMCLTEADSGSNLAGLKTAARRDGDRFRVVGAKQFISWGDHDLTDNIIHLVLARIEGAPAGVKGISLFIVPKIKVGPDGSPCEPNDVFCAGVEEKMGLHASPTCRLIFGENNDCEGFLCGPENQGLPQMFQMMNSARINTGVSGMALGGAAYAAALEYCKTRSQGSDLARRKPGDVPIIDHPDVRRMLLWMKGAVDGMRSMIYNTAYWEDLARHLPEGEERRRCGNILEFMTPIVKAYCSDLGFRVCETAVQCLGGYGYCRDYPVEQYLRDAKIMSLYEGTNGIQSMDLLGRKMTINHGGPFAAFRSALDAFCDREADHPALGPQVRALGEFRRSLWSAAETMRDRMKTDPLQWASGTYPALQAFGDAAACWLLLDLAVKAAPKASQDGPNRDFFAGKVFQARYFVDVTLPHAAAHLKNCLRDGREVVDIPEAAF
ncbi:MAG: acyl-CoA dehydrogenase [Pseudomonadota bacterium]